MFKFILAMIVIAILSGAAFAQQLDTTRDLWDTAFVQKRPPAKTITKRTQPVKYRIVSKSIAPSTADRKGASAVVGVTIWRLRPSKQTDDQSVRQLVHQEGEWTPERVTAGAPLGEGSRVQLTIESPRKGYLYVLDREIYADKTFGEAYLIFPTLSLNDGDNKVDAGRIVEIPSSGDKPPYYTLKRSRADHDGEALTVIVSEKPLPGLTIGRNAQNISTEQFAKYEKQWGAMTQQLELEKGAGTAMTKAEKAAASGQGNLTQEDSMPQTIYRVVTRPDQPLLITIPLSIRPNSDKATQAPGSE
jgi:hypothetical protein